MKIYSLLVDFFMQLSFIRLKYMHLVTTITIKKNTLQLTIHAQYTLLLDLRPLQRKKGGVIEAYYINRALAVRYFFFIISIHFE